MSTTVSREAGLVTTALYFAIKRAMEAQPLKVTLPNIVDNLLILKK
jgi:hypothetical protein